MYRLILLILLASAYPTLAAAPTVTEAEQKILEQAGEMEDRAEAIAWLGQQTTEESSAALDFTQGSWLLEAGDAQAAIEHLRLAVEKAPAFHLARYNLALAHQQAGEADQAAALLRQVVYQQVAAPGDAWLALGTVYHELGRWTAAEEAFRQALAFRPDDPELRRAILKLALDQGDVHKAEELARRELAHSPTKVDLWLVRAKAALEGGRESEAIVRLEIARRLGLLDATSLMTLGDLFLEQRLYAQALDIYQTVTEQPDPSEERLLASLDALIQLDQLEAASQLLEKLGPELRNTVKAKRLEADLAVRKGASDHALALYQELLDTQPMDAGLMLALGDLHQAQGNREEARVLYTRASRVSQAHRLRAYVKLAQLAVQEEDYGQARAHIEAALEIERRPYLERYLQQLP